MSDSVKPAASRGEREDDAVIAIAARAYERGVQAGREAGFAEAKALAKAECRRIAKRDYRMTSEELWECDGARRCDEAISELTCPPAADGSEVSDGE